MSDPVVDPSDLGTYLGAPVDEGRAELLIQYAQALCEAVVTPLPSGAAAVVIDVVVRALMNPGNVQSEAVGPFPVSFGAVSGGLWLTNNNKATLRRLAGQVGAFTIDTMPATAGQGLPWWDFGTVTDGWDIVPS